MADADAGYRWWVRYVLVPLIGGGGLTAVIVAYINRPSPSLQENPKSQAATSISQPSSEFTPASPSATTSPPPQPEDATKNMRLAGEKRYEITKVVAVDKAFTDPETGLTFGVEEVYNEKGSWFSPTMKGATVTYTLPNGESDYGGRDVGFRENFMFRGRNFLMVIEAMDFQGHTVTIRIKEV